MKKRLFALLAALALCVSSLVLCVPSSADSSFPFGDVTAKRWSNPYVVLMYNEGIVNGMTENAFVPDGNVTRAQFVTMLGRFEKIDVNSQSKTTIFTDVQSDKWYTPYIAWANENGIVYGVTPTTFDPDENIKRQEIVAMIYRYLNFISEDYVLPTDKDEIDFTDKNSIDSWAYDAMYALQRAGIISGIANDNGTLRCEPKSTATREQACKMLAVLYCILYNVSLPAPVEPVPYTITYNLNGGTANGLKTTYNGDDSFTLPTPTRSAYDFVGWTGTGLSKATKTVTIKKDSYGDRKYTANWTATKFDISYNLNGGTISGAPTSYTIETPTFTIPTPSRSGYIFTGWSGTGINGTTTTYTVKKGTVGWISLKANWISKQKKAFDLLSNWTGDRSTFNSGGYYWASFDMDTPSDEFKQDIWSIGYSNSENKICIEIYHEYLSGAEYLNQIYLTANGSSFEYIVAFEQGSSYYVMSGNVSSKINNTMNITYKKLDSSSDFSSTEDVKWIKEQVRTGLCNLKLFANDVFADIGAYGYDMSCFGL